MNIGLLSFGAVPVLLSLYKYCQRKTILRPDNAYDFIVVGGNKNLSLPLAFLSQNHDNNLDR
jgi:hypothetical protein